MSRILEGVGSGVLRNEESYPDLARPVSKVKKEYGWRELKPVVKPVAKEWRSSSMSRTNCRVHDDCWYEACWLSVVVVIWCMIRIVYNQKNRRKHGPPTLGSYTRLTLPDKNASKMQTKRPIKKLEKADILIIIWNTYPTHFKSNHGQQWSTK